ncbi:hypothetical protein M0Q50_00795 [bacterium]|jgi:hypothetical protein|nr:hypothetical protein [bacterium]
MPECDGHACYEKTDYTKGVYFWVIETHWSDIKRIEVWGENVQKAKEFNELLGKPVFVRIFKKEPFWLRIINSFKKDPEEVQITGNMTITLVAHCGAAPILLIGETRVYVNVIKKIHEWAGYAYCPLQKAPP